MPILLRSDLNSTPLETVHWVLQAVGGRNPAPPGMYKTHKWWDKLPINWCRISSINSITPKMRVTCEVSELKFRSIRILFFCCDWSKDNLKVLLENRWEFRWLVFWGWFMEKGLSTKSVPFLGCSYFPPEHMPAENLSIKMVRVAGWQGP